jgi:hypothetical protein
MLILKLLSHIYLHLTRNRKIILTRIRCFSHPSDTTVSIAKASNMNLSAAQRYWRVTIQLHTTLHSALDRDDQYHASAALSGERERGGGTAVPISKSGWLNTPSGHSSEQSLPFPAIEPRSSSMQSSPLTELSQFHT